jgi:hypothetical protein
VSQPNARNVTDTGSLSGVAVNPDGQYWQYRIIDARQFVFTTTFRMYRERAPPKIIRSLREQRDSCSKLRPFTSRASKNSARGCPA